jgi:DNA repair protein RadC
MAGGSRKTREPASAPRAVEDSELFPFQHDATPPIVIARGKPARAKAEKPHYHDHRARLRTRFGDLAAVLATPVQRIAEVSGAGPAVAQDLKIVQALLERASKAPLKQRTVISSWSQLVNYCRMSMAHAPREQFRVLFLDAKNQLIADEMMNEGTVDHAPVYPREIARRALEHSAAAVILVHNHPSGDPKPSAADLAITREIVAAAEAISVKVHDHLVIGRNGVESFKSLGLL